MYLNTQRYVDVGSGTTNDCGDVKDSVDEESAKQIKCLRCDKYNWKKKNKLTFAIYLCSYVCGYLSIHILRA